MKIEHDPTLYKQRNRIKRMSGHLNINRAIATRYDQLANSFLGMVHLATAKYWLNLSTPPSQTRIICRIMSVASMVVTIVIPVVVGWSLWSASDTQLLIGLGSPVRASEEVGSFAVLSVRTLLLLPSFAMSYALLALSRFFAALAKARPFAAATYDHLRKFALALGLSSLAGIATRVMAGLVIGLSTQGSFPVSLRFGTPEMFAIGMAILAYVLARVLQEACLIANENQQFV